MSHTELQLLLAIPSRTQRYRAAVDTGTFKDIAKVCQRWLDVLSRHTFERSGVGGGGVAPVVAEDVYVYLLDLKGLPDKAVGMVQYIGALPSCSGLWFGVRLAPVCAFSLLNNKCVDHLAIYTFIIVVVLVLRF